MNKYCSEQGCPNKAVAKGFCINCYARKRYRNLPDCIEPGCAAKAISRGFCKKHKKHKPPNGPRYCLHCGINIDHKRSDSRFCSKNHMMVWRYWNQPGVRERQALRNKRNKNMALIEP